MKNQEIILDTDPNIVEYRTNIEGWVGKDGRFYGKEKQQAIYNNSTHKECEKGHIYKKFYIECPNCRAESLPEKYLQLKFEEWDGETPLFLYDSDDKYFFSEDEVLEWIADEEIPHEDVRLVICVPEHLPEIEEEYFQEAIPGDWELKDVSKEIHQKLLELNELIRKHGPSCWYPGNIRTTINLNP